jgi:hypothetical protein
VRTLVQILVAALLAVAAVAVFRAFTGDEPPDPFAGSNPPAAAKNDSSPLPRAFEDGVYSLRFPTGWRLTDHTARGGMIRADLVSPDGGSGLQVRLLETSGEDVDAFVERYVAAFVDDMRSHWRGTVSVAGRRSLTVAGHRLVTVSLTHRRDDGSAWLLKQYLWFSPPQVVVLQAGTPLAERDRIEPVLDAIAASLEAR